MKKNLSNLKNNKKLMNWIIMSGLTITIGISLILNIIFIPKYIETSKQNLSATTEITIDAVIGQANDKNAEILFNPIEYDTNFSTLGDLIKHFTNHYLTKSYPGAGDLLTGVSKENNKQYIQPSPEQSWFIYRFDNSKKQWIQPDDGSTGMDLLTLHNYDQYRLALFNWN